MGNRIRQFRKLIILVLGSLAMSGAIAAEPANSLQQISVAPSGDLPAGFQAEVDILFVYDENLLAGLPFTQFDWISGRDAYLNDATADMEVIRLTVSAEEGPTVVTLPQRHSEAVGILVFASHEDPVADAIDITTDSIILLQIVGYGINVIAN